MGYILGVKHCYNVTCYAGCWGFLGHGHRSTEEQVKQAKQAKRAGDEPPEAADHSEHDESSEQIQVGCQTPGCQPPETKLVACVPHPFGGLAGAAPLAAAPQSFVNLVTLCSFMSTHGLAKSLLPHLAYLITKFGGDVGHSNHHRDFVTIVEHRSDELIYHSTLNVLQKTLPATGQIPDVTLILDAGVIGKYYHHYRDGCLTIGLIFPVQHPPYRVALLLDIVVECADGRFPAIRKYLEKAFAPLGGLDKWLDVHLAMLCGDGAYISGGIAAKKKSDGLLENIWGDRGNRNRWDDFHCMIKAMEHTIKESPMIEVFFRHLTLGQWSKLFHIFCIGGHSVLLTMCIPSTRA